ncbi:Acyl-CoA synthetase OS=Streptomyces glaucescens OX=1907 GN=fadD15a PE=4 SV=1 [Streptomyces glaucescens]
MRIADDGEVLLHGEHLFKEYWNNPGATEEALEDGWFVAGDLGTLDEDGYLRITGRKKEIIVTAGGRRAPAVIEDRIPAHALVTKCMVVGDGRPFVGALVTIDEEFLGRWAAEHGKPASSTAASLREDADLLAAIQTAIDDGNAAVSKAESVRKFRVLPAQFTEDSGHLTPSLKLKRNVVAKDFADEIEAIYAK